MFIGECSSRAQQTNYRFYFTTFYKILLRTPNYHAVPRVFAMIHHALLKSNENVPSNWVQASGSIQISLSFYTKPKCFSDFWHGTAAGLPASAATTAAAWVSICRLESPKEVIALAKNVPKLPSICVLQGGCECPFAKKKRDFESRSLASKIWIRPSQ